MAVDVDRLVEVARGELACLWYDLHDARMYAYSGQWSMKCGSLVERIKALTPLVGPTPWEEIQIPLLEAGVYQRIHAELGIDSAEVRPDMVKVSEMRARMDAQSAAIRAGR